MATVPPKKTSKSDENENSESMILCPADMPCSSRRAFLQQMIDNLPKSVHNRVLALKNLQLEHIHKSEQFFRDVYELEKNYYDKASDILEMRRQIVEGHYEPSKQKKSWKDEPNPLIEEIRSSKEFKEVTQLMKHMPPTARGIPKFWLTIFRNVSMLSDWVEEHDEPLLERLVDITLKYDNDAYSFEFCFEPNDYLLTNILTKKYYLRHTADEDSPFAFEGPEIYKCEGCAVPWREGKNLTQHMIETKRGRTKTVIRKSFFRFFTPPAAVDLSLADDNTRMALGADFELGYLLRTQIVPKAILFYTGDLIEGTNEDEVDNGNEENNVEEERRPSKTTEKRKKKRASKK